MNEQIIIYYKLTLEQSPMEYRHLQLLSGHRSWSLLPCTLQHPVSPL